MKKLIINILVWIVSITTAAIIALFIYYLPVIDRLVNPCQHYPNFFADCTN